MNKNNDSLIDCLIIGGGIVGLCTAIAMRQRHYTVAILDKHPLQATPNNPQRVFAINTASQRLLTLLNAWPSAAHLSPYHTMYVWDQHQHASIEFDSRSIGESELGFIIEESSLKNALYAELKRQEIILLPPLEALELLENEDQITVKACDTDKQEQTLSANFVFITDGAKSNLRKKLGLPLTTWPYHHHATVATVQTEKNHQNTAYQIFTDDGPLAFLPLTDKNQCSIVWSNSYEKTQYLQSLSDDEFNQTLTQTFEQKLGNCQLISHRQQFELQMRHTDQYHGKRWILMGDAAHTIHPLAGLGLNLGLADLQTWLQLTQHSKILNHSSILGAYQRSRKSATWAVIGLMELIKQTFSTPAFPIQWLRGLGMNFLNHITPLKRQMIRYARGE